MINRNSYHLNTTTPSKQQTRDDIEALINAVLCSVDPALAVRKFLQFDGQLLKAGERCYIRSAYQNIYLVGIGKAAIPMALSATDILKDDFSSGLVITKKLNDSDSLNTRIRVLTGDHPIPGKNSIKAAEELLAFLRNITPEDLVIFLISGGGSALISKPVPGLGLEDIRKITDCLLNESVPIQQINMIRKHLDMVKGGRLLGNVYPAQVISLVLSDVIGNDLSIVASGPTIPDPSSYQDCLDIITEHNLVGNIPTTALSFLRQGAAGKQIETPKPEQVDTKFHDEILIGNIDLAMNAVLETGCTLGYKAERSKQYLLKDIEVEERRIIFETSDHFSNEERHKSIIIWGGEVTVNRKEGGKGGRNQHMSLLLSKEFINKEGIVGVTLATDGEDGSTEAAGAIIDSSTMDRATALGLDYHRAVRDQNSYCFFQKLNDLIFTGSTGSNVNDLVFLVKE